MLIYKGHKNVFFLDEAPKPIINKIDTRLLRYIHNKINSHKSHTRKEFVIFMIDEQYFVAYQYSCDKISYYINIPNEKNYEDYEYLHDLYDMKKLFTEQFVLFFLKQNSLLNMCREYILDNIKLFNNCALYTLNKDLRKLLRLKTKD